MPRHSPYAVVLTDEERRTLQEVSRRYTSPYCEVTRAKVVLLASEGLENTEIALRLDLPRQVVSKWRKRFCHGRLAGLESRPRRGRPSLFPPRGRRRGQGPGVRTAQ
jgi:transposase-like protein